MILPTLPSPKCSAVDRGTHKGRPRYPRYPRYQWLSWLVFALLGGHAPPTFADPPQTQAQPQAPEPAAPLDGRDGRELSLRNFRPRSELRVPQHLLTRAKFPVVDVHTHFRHRLRHDPEALDGFVELMDRNNIAVCVSLDGKLGPDLASHRDYLWKRYRDRFVIFTNVDWQGDGEPDKPETWACHQSGFARHVAKQLAEAKRAGVSGLKVFKQFGLVYKNPDGSLIRIDDPRWDPIWQACGELGLPVIIHTADPAAFFKPIDAFNERWEELSRHPDWSFYGDGFPSRDELLEARNRVIRRHPRTIFLGAHVANQAEDLSVVDKWLEELPNLYVEFASRIGELGRQPYSARRFLVKHADRLMFGTDGPWPETRIRLYWRFVETFDENFPYSEKDPPPQGLWQIHGIGLPDDVLRKLYYENAAKLIPGVAERLKTYESRTSEP
ncbi:MAG: amidohydrolase [Planctomycetales bacterium]|nr:amidohydrolase [Planctomycetales bacterium]